MPSGGEILNGNLTTVYFRLPRNSQTFIGSIFKFFHQTHLIAMMNEEQQEVLEISEEVVDLDVTAGSDPEEETTGEQEEEEEEAVTGEDDSEDDPESEEA